MLFFKSGRRRGSKNVPADTEKPPAEVQPAYCVANLQGLGARRGQEDSFTIANAFDADKIREEGLFFAVCDGMGGMKDGKLASETAIRSLRQSFFEMDRSGDMAAQLRQSIFQASAQVEDLIGGDGGSTVVMGILYRESLYYASVGDSFLYLLRGGRLLRLNTEHNLLHERYLEALREGEMDPLALCGMPEETALTGFLGMVGLEDADCSVRPLPMNKGDVLLACSDGVGGVLSPAEIAGALGKEEPQAMCSELQERIALHDKVNQDNYTAIVIKCIL